jgi:hypothetical protein
MGIALRTVYPYTGQLKTSGPMLVTARFNAFPGEYRQATVADSAAPVIDSATYIYSTGASGACDTLRVVFSELVNAIQSQTPFLLSGKSTSYAFTLSPIALAGKNATFCVTSISAQGVPQSGDFVWIAPNNSVSDAGGVFQNNGNNRKVALKVVRPASKWKASVECNPFAVGSGFICPAAQNGRTGTVILLKQDPPSPSPLPAAPYLRIFDMLGNSIFEGPTDQKSADGNSYYFVWDGRNKNNRFVGSGVYRAIVTVVDENGTTKLPVSIGVKR